MADDDRTPNAERVPDEERIRNLAHKIWESEGRPEGQQQRHWDMALKIVIAEREEGVDVELEEVGEPVDEAPLLEDDLPLEDDEIGIQENRLPLDAPDGEPDFDELPYRDDRDVAQDVPVQDRGSPGPAKGELEPGPGPMRPLPPESATVKRTRQPRREEDGLTQPDATVASQVPDKTAKRGAKRSTRSSSSTAKPKASTSTTQSSKSRGDSSHSKTRK